MDTLLVNRDHCTDSRGIPVTVAGDSEIIQRALIRLCVKKGALDGEPTLGSELYRLKNARTQDAARIAMSYVQEALSPMPGVSVSDVSVAQSQTGALEVRVTIEYQGRSYNLAAQVIG